jgi:hypothetical protein
VRNRGWLLSGSGAPYSGEGLGDMRYMLRDVTWHMGGFVRWDAICVFTGLVGPMGPQGNSYSSSLITCLCSIEWVQYQCVRWRGWCGCWWLRSRGPNFNFLRSTEAREKRSRDCG